MKKKREYEDEILRLCKVLTQMKYDEQDDINIKKLIAENLRCIAELTNKEREQREARDARKRIERYKNCC